MPRLKKACQKMSAPTPMARTAPKRSLAVAAMRIPDDQEAIQKHEADAPENSPVFGEDGEREVECLPVGTRTGSASRA